MAYKSAVFLIFILSGLNLYAQKRLKGAYDAAKHEFICTDANVIVKRFANGRAAFMIKGTNPFDEKSNRVGFIDTTGTIVIKPVYADCSNFRRGYALVMDTARREAVINTSGKIIIPFGKQYIASCPNGLFIKNSYANPRGISIVDNNNKTVVPFGKYTSYADPLPPIYGLPESTDDVGHREFSWYQLQFFAANFNKYIGVKTGAGKDGKWAVINSKGTEVIPPKFDRIGVFINGLAAFCINNKYGITDTAGNQVIPPLYDNIELSGSDFAIAVQNNKSGLLSLTNKLVIPFKYNRIGVISTGVFIVDSGKMGNYANRYGVIGKNAATIIPVENINIQAFGSGYLVYKANDSIAVFDSTGVRKTGYGPRDYLKGLVWEMGNEQGYTVYNKSKRDFVHYDEVIDLMYREDDKWGLLDSACEEVTKAIYDEIEYLSNYPAIVKARRGKLWDILNNEGKEIIPGPFDEIEPENDAFKLKKNGRYGAINSIGKVILLPVFDEIALDRTEDYVKSESITVRLNGKWGYYDYYGRQLTPPKYDVAGPMQQGYAVVTINNKQGLINNKGVEIVHCKYDNIRFGYGSLLIVSQNKLYGLINRSGKVVLPLTCSSINIDRLNNILPTFFLKRNGKVGMADTSGRQFFPFKYDQADSMTPFSGRPAEELTIKDNGLFGVADMSGNLIVPPLYDVVSLLGGMSKKRYEVRSDGKEGIVDENGKLIIPCIYTYLTEINDRSMVVAKDGPFGVIDWKQNVIVPLIYQNVRSCNAGYIVISNEKYGARNLNGDEIIPIVYDNITGYFQNIFILSKNHKMGVIDDTGKIILPVVYDNIEPCGAEKILVKKDNLMGLIDYTGKVIYPCKYTFINCVDGKVVEIY